MEPRTLNIALHIGSLRLAAWSRRIGNELIALAPATLTLQPVPIGELPLYNFDLETDTPPPAWTAYRRQIAASDGLLFVTPEYNRGIPGSLKNAIDWASRPWGKNSFNNMPCGVIGASVGKIGTAVGQQSLRAALSFCNARQMTAPEAYIHFSHDVFQDDGEVDDDATTTFLRDYMMEFHNFITLVRTVLPHPSAT